jgi:Flp pilus assembly protein TadG
MAQSLKNRNLGSHRTQKGQSLVEVALMMPLLVLMLAGILDLGRAYMTLVALNDAAAEGAAYAAIHPTHTNEIVERAADSSNALVTLDPTLVRVDCASPPTPGGAITVTVGYEYQVLTPVVNAMVPDGVLVMRAVEVRSIVGQD